MHNIKIYLTIIYIYEIQHCRPNISLQIKLPLFVQSPGLLKLRATAFKFIENNIYKRHLTVIR